MISELELQDMERRARNTGQTDEGGDVLRLIAYARVLRDFVRDCFTSCPALNVSELEDHSN